MARTNNALYKVSIIPNEENSKTKIYYGFSETAFKLRYANHKKNSAPSNVKIMQYYQTNIGISCQQTKLQSYHGKSWEPSSHAANF